MAIAKDPAALARLEERVRQGEWLTPGPVAALLGIGRTSVHRLLESGGIRWRPHAGAGRYRLLHPEDVLARLEQSRGERRGEIQEDDPDQA